WPGSPGRTGNARGDDPGRDLFAVVQDAVRLADRDFGPARGALAFYSAATDEPVDANTRSVVAGVERARECARAGADDWLDRAVVVRHCVREFSGHARVWATRRSV